MAPKTLDKIAHILSEIAHLCFYVGGALVFLAMLFMVCVGGNPYLNTTELYYTALAIFGVTLIFGFSLALVGTAFFGSLANVFWALEFEARTAEIAGRQ